jgi:uncharacterized membrane protein/YHS domain-containing protein
VRRRGGNPGFALIVIGAMLAARTSVGAASQEPVAPARPQPGQMCPVMPDEEVDPEIYVDYRGQRIYLCCDKCKRKFLREPDRYVTIPAAAEMPGAGPQPPAGDPRPASPGRSVREGRTGVRLLDWLGGLHPASIHLPIGVAIAACLAEILFMRTRRAEFDHAARFSLFLAAIAGVPAAALGWLYGGFRLTDREDFLTLHRWLGTAAAVWLLAALWAGTRAWRGRGGRSGRATYRGLLLTGTALVVAAGFFGGAMVYGVEHYFPR